MDSGANGGLAGADVRILDTHDSHCVDITGILGAETSSVPLCTCAGVVTTNMGPAIAIMHQYAALGTGRTIYSVSQLEAFGILVDTRS